VGIHLVRTPCTHFASLLPRALSRTSRPHLSRALATPSHHWHWCSLLPSCAHPARPSQAQCWWQWRWCWWCSCAAARPGSDLDGWNRPAPASPILQNACLKCFKCFIDMLQVFHMVVAKLDRDVADATMLVLVCCKLLFPMFHLFFSNVRCKCVYLDVAYVSHICCKCFIWMLLCL
jgi:hypothetical protein